MGSLILIVLYDEINLLLLPLDIAVNEESLNPPSEDKHDSNKWSSPEDDEDCEFIK